MNYFAVGHSSECFKRHDWLIGAVDKRLREDASSKIGWRRRSGAIWRMLGNERASAGSGWSRPWLYDTLKLFSGYRVRRDVPKVAPA